MPTESFPFVVATFYKFVHLPDAACWRDNLLALCGTQQITGTIILATEGINSTIAGSPEGITAVLETLTADARFRELAVKFSRSAKSPFRRLKVKIKPEIVTMGLPALDPARQSGKYVAPEEWNRLISDPEVVVIDTRNDYEVRIGTFRRAQNPRTRSFREFPEFAEQHLAPLRDRKIAMFCTGGIRCEKATAYLREKGFTEVYHLQGGILQYLESVPPAESLWEGECFVFDERVAVDHSLAQGHYQLCTGCGQPVAAGTSACEACAGPRTNP